MSRDGYLPPGCTERDVDMSAPDYWDSHPGKGQMDRSEWEDEQRRNDRPETVLDELEDGFRWLVNNGYQETAQAKWEEIGIALRWLKAMQRAAE